GLALCRGVLRTAHSHGRLATAQGGRKLLVAREDLDTVGFEAVKERPGFVVSPGDEQAGRVGRGGAEEWLGDRDFSFPPACQEIVHALGAIYRRGQRCCWRYRCRGAPPPRPRARPSPEV